MLDDGIVLHDDLDIAAGQHVLVFRSLEREVIHVADAVDPDDRAGDGRLAAAGSAPDLHQLTATAITSTTLQCAPVWRSASPERTLQAFGTDHGLWLLESEGGSGTTAEAHQASAADIDDLARQFLTRRG